MKTTKTFPKGTDYDDLFDYLDDQICDLTEYNRLQKQVTITIETKEE